MIDTVRLKYAISPTEEQLQHWTEKISVGPTGIRKYYIYNPVIDETTLRFTYYPTDYSGNPLLTLEVSLPKLTIGNNYQMIASIEGTILLGNMTLDAVPHIPKLDLAEGVLIRLDLCFNHQVGEFVDPYIRAMSSLDFPHRRAKFHRHEGVEFRSRHKTTKFYNKELESGMSEAHGILRQEMTLINPKDIQKLLRKKQPTLLDVSKELIIEFLNDDLQRLRLFGVSIPTRSSALKSLSERYGSDAGLYYFGLLVSKMEKSKKQLQQDLNMPKHNLNRKIRNIVDARIPPTFADGEESLPPLVVNL